jgi:serine/threonine protein kinase
MSDTLIAGRYRLEELLGRSGMSEVWAATDSELGRRVALKLLAPNADTARFEREARAVAALAHPNVNQLYDYGEEDGRPFMVLEYLPGGTLEDRLRASGGPLPDAETEAIAADVARGLAHAHSRGVVHRDLKPTNVLFDEEGRAKLADFGIARLMVGEGTLTEAGTVLGTAAYLSPEQAMGAPASTASDVYSFGVILFRMLTGRLPFESDDPLELVALHRDVEAPRIASIRPDAPSALEAAATVSLAKHPAERPGDGAALLAALGLDEGAGLATPPTVLATTEPTRVMAPPPPARERRGSLVAFAALLVLALAGAGLAYALTRPSNSPSAPPPTTAKPLTTRPTTTAAPTTATKPRTTTRATTTAPAPPVHTATAHTTAPATTTAPPPPPTTTAPQPTTTAPPPTTTAPQPTTTSGP